MWADKCSANFIFTVFQANAALEMVQVKKGVAKALKRASNGLFITVLLTKSTHNLKLSNDVNQFLQMSRDIVFNLIYMITWYLTIKLT